MEIIYGREKQEGDTLVDRLTLALAKIQGPWSDRSKHVLENEFSEDDVKNAPFVEKTAISMLTKAVELFYGDGSAAHLLLGHPVNLSEKDRGLIVLRELMVNYSEPGQWETAAVITAEITNGTSFKKISSRLNKGIKGFLTVVKKVFKKASQGEGFDAGRLESIEGDPLENLYGGSDEMLSKNKEKLRQDILSGLKRRLNSMSQDEIVLLSNKLKNTTGDVMLDSSLDSAKLILTDLLKSKQEDLNKTLSLIS